MPIPGVGGWEFLVILIAALMIFGPSKLPEVMGQMGKAVRDFRKMTTNFSTDFEKNLNDAAGTDVRKTLSSELSNVRSEVEGVGKSVSGSVNKGIGAGGKTSRTSSAVGSKTTAAKSGAAKGTGTVVGAGRSATARGTNSVSSTSRAGQSSTTSSAKSATGSRTAGVKSSQVVESAPPATASKVDPLSDVSLFDDDLMTAKPVRRGSTVVAKERDSAVAATAISRRVGSDNGSFDGAQPIAISDDPVQRARQRRSSAGYQRAAAR